MGTYCELFMADYPVFPSKSSVKPDLNGTTEPFSDQLQVWSDLAGKRISPEGKIIHP